MAKERKTPYQMLMEDARAFARKVQYPQTKGMWLYPKARLGEAWVLSDLNERVAAADQLGYDVVLISDTQGLHVKYRKKPPTAPFGWNV